MPTHNFNPKPSMVVVGILVPLGLMVVAGLLGKMWIVWLAVVYVAVMLSVSGAIKLRQAARREEYTRWRAGQCASCGYDLTGNTSGVCPECGKAMPSPPPEPGREIF
jgi:hypothetical protein